MNMNGIDKMQHRWIDYHEKWLIKVFFFYGEGFYVINFTISHH